MKRQKIFLLLLLVIFNATLSLANTNEYQITFPENNLNINSQKDFYNEIGTLKITASDSFDETQRVVVAINYDGKFINSKNSSQSQIINYDLAIKTLDSYKILNDGDKIEFSAALIDEQSEIKLGVILKDEALVGAYESEIKFSSIILPVVGTKSYEFGKYKWRVLSVDETERRAFLITENCVNKMNYNKSANNAWSTSDIRAWLNGTGNYKNKNNFFTGAALNASEKSQILRVNLKDNDNSDSATILDDNGEDKIFLLSSADAYIYFKDKPERIADSRWWLRTPGASSNNPSGFTTSTIIFIQADGGLSDGGTVNGKNYVLGVRPALWLDLSKTEEKISSSIISFIKIEDNKDKDKDDEDEDTDLNDNDENNDDVPPKESSPDENKNLNDEELKEKFDDDQSIILSGDMDMNNSDKDKEEIENFIKKIEDSTEIKNLDFDFPDVNCLKNFSLPYDSKLEELIIENNNALINLDVSGTSLKKLIVNNCSKLERLNCESCDIIEINIKGCEGILYLNCSYNNLARLDVSDLKNLRELKCNNQFIKDVRRAESFNFFDFLFRLDIDSKIFSTASVYSSEFERVKNLMAFNESGEIIEVNLDENLGLITFSEEPEIIKYDYETGFKNILMDVTVETVASEASDDDSHDSDGQDDGGNGGCNFGLNFFAAVYLFKNLFLLKSLNFYLYPKE